MEDSVKSDIDWKISSLSGRVEEISRKQDRDSKPWYKNAATFISLAAFVFSLGTTYVSYRRNVEQDIQNSRSELRGFLQRLSALPERNLEAYKKYSDDPASFSIVSGFIAQENNLLSKQAAETLNRLPVERISSTDYYAVGQSLQNNRDYDRAIQFLNKAVNAANGLDDEVNALRGLGGLMFLTGRSGDGRDRFQQALDIFSKYRGYDAFTIESGGVLTELVWAVSEANGGFADDAERHLLQAERHASNAPAGPGQQLLRSQVTQARNQVAMTQQSKIPANVTTIPVPEATPYGSPGPSQNGNRK